MNNNFILHFLKLVRWPNLLIVGLTQFFLQYLVLIPAFRQANLTSTLDGLHFLLLVLCTLCIAGAGYIINDIIDVPIDRINKPNKMVIGKHYSISTGYRLYFLVLILGGIIAFYLASYVGNLGLTGLYLGANLLLFLYSKYFKKQPFIGNLVVAIFCAFVAGIVLFAEHDSFDQLSSNGYSEITWLCYGYLLFAFLSTMFREIVKDIEDIDGDLKKNCVTLPILLGIKVAKGIAILFGVLLLVITIYWFVIQIEIQELFPLIYLAIGIILPIFVAIIYLIKAGQKKQLGQISLLAKYLMVSGIFYLLILSF